MDNADPLSFGEKFLFPEQQYQERSAKPYEGLACFYNVTPSFSNKRVPGGNAKDLGDFSRRFSVLTGIDEGKRDTSRIHLDDDGSHFGKLTTGTDNDIYVAFVVQAPFTSDGMR